jgi:hypothetical protein
MRASRVAACGMLVAACTCALPARSQEAAKREETPAEALAARRRPRTDRPVTLFHAGLGLLALPFTKVCPNVVAECQPGDTSLAASLMVLVRLRQLAFGAGADVAFGLRPELTTQPGRQHTRSYFSFDALFRYYLPPLKRLDWWVGGSIGAVVLSDTWSTDLDRNPYSDAYFVGPKRLTLRSEGISFGPSIGAHWRFSDRWLIGTQARYCNWIFPGPRAVTPLGDQASLAGRIDAFEVGVLMGFRIGL